MQGLTYRDTFSDGDVVCIRLLTPDSFERCDAKVLRISLDYIEILASVSVSPGALIQLRNKGAFLLCEACSSTAVDGGFQIGAEVQDTFLTQMIGSFHPDSPNDPISLRA
ncbi:MAG TPA: hypothetical protein VGG72_01715 [Bryobacteraceae bacterium]|jgi:hypothetical protein